MKTKVGESGIYYLQGTLVTILELVYPQNQAIEDIILALVLLPKLGILGLGY